MIIIALLIGGAIGYVISLNVMMNLFIGYGVKYLNAEGINISIDRAEIAEDLFRYKNRISECQ